MGVRILEGSYDGTTQAAVMVDSISGFAFGPIFEGYNAAGQIEEFLGWLAREPYRGAPDFGLEPSDIPDPVRYATATDPRIWPDSGLEKLVAFWRKTVLDEAPR